MNSPLITSVDIHARERAGACRSYAAHAHGIVPSSISTEALHVVRSLRDAGYEAYLVGGCVRDLLLGRKPKDFDVSTNALPGQVHGLFRRSRIVGRRFQIVHVRSGRDVIEVSTFRGHHSPDFGEERDAEGGDAPAAGGAVRAESGMLLRDNVFGTVEEDALRRDFSVNGLYYDPDTNCVLDFSTGVEDLEARVLRVIGDPVRRYQEDPVRMLRAVRFAATLGFTIEAHALSAIGKCRHLLSQVAAARMFDEILKLLLSGRGEETFVLLDRFGLFAPLFPDTASALERNPQARSLILHALRNSDQRIAIGKPVTPAFLYAALLWPALQQRMKPLLENEKLPQLAALHQAIPETIMHQARSTTIPRRYATPMREIWELQQRLIARRQPDKLAAHPRFRAAYDFILLREQAGESVRETSDWWTRFQSGEALPVVPQRTARRRRRRGKATSAPDAG